MYIIHTRRPPGPRPRVRPEEPIIEAYRIVAIFYPFSQFCEINITLLSLKTQPNTAPNLFQRGVENGKYVPHIKRPIRKHYRGYGGEADVMMRCYIDVGRLFCKDLYYGKHCRYNHMGCVVKSFQFVYMSFSAVV